VLLGGSDAGKSTLLALIAGALEPDAGQILLDGEDLAALDGRERKMGILLQGFRLDPALPLVEIVAGPPRPKSFDGSPDAGDRRERARAILSELGIAESEHAKCPAALAPPLRRVVALARALLPNPEILLCDEPTTALDPDAAQRVERVLAAASDRRATVLLTTFDLPLAFRIGHCISLLEEGRIAACGTPQQLLADPPPALRQLLQRCGAPRLAEGRAGAS
jgi:ABC-type sulfate/molybdate transport systems ATPase subunit